MKPTVAITIGILFLLSSGKAPAGKKKSTPAVLMAGSAKSTQIFDSLDPATAGYPAWTALSPGKPPCDRKQVDRMFGPALKRLLKEKEKQNQGKPVTFGMPDFEAPQALLGKYIKRHCRLGKGRLVAAHGPGWIKKIKLKEFKARLSPTSFDRGAFLSISAATNLKERPFFYTTVVPASDQNHFQAAQDIQLPSTKVSETEKQIIISSLPKQDDADGYGSMSFYRYSKDGLLARVERNGTRGTNPKYQARWIDYLLLPAGKKKALVVFRGDSDFVRESNRMELVGVLDMDGDGDLDVLLRASQCIVLARRTKKGFDSFRLSNLF